MAIINKHGSNMDGACKFQTPGSYDFDRAEMDSPSQTQQMQALDTSSMSGAAFDRDGYGGTM